MPHDVKVYPGVGHGFMNDHDPADLSVALRILVRLSRTEYDEPATRDARRRIVAFFDTYLQVGRQLSRGQAETGSAAVWRSRVRTDREVRVSSAIAAYATPLQSSTSR